MTSEAIDVNALLRDVRSSEGALCLFLGVVRDENAGRETVEILYEAYGPMAEEELSRIAAEICREWPGSRLRIRHRTGRVRVGEPSVAIAATAPHRADAFAACRAAIDRIKTRVPIWKKEFHPDGSSDWVDPTALVPFAVSGQEDS
ncbi:MAG: molybdenum cofactor biosynthesis protein MoaE [Thermoanaerobaculia bacterium]